MLKDVFERHIVDFFARLKKADLLENFFHRADTIHSSLPMLVSCGGTILLLDCND